MEGDGERWAEDVMRGSVPAAVCTAFAAMPRLRAMPARRMFSLLFFFWPLFLLLHMASTGSVRLH